MFPKFYFPAFLFDFRFLRFSDIGDSRHIAITRDQSHKKGLCDFWMLCWGNVMKGSFVLIGARGRNSIGDIFTAAERPPNPNVRSQTHYKKPFNFNFWQKMTNIWCSISFSFFFKEMNFEIDFRWKVHFISETSKRTLRVWYNQSILKTKTRHPGKLFESPRNPNITKKKLKLSLTYLNFNDW